MKEMNKLTSMVMKEKQTPELVFQARASGRNHPARDEAARRPLSPQWPFLKREADSVFYGLHPYA